MEKNHTAASFAAMYVVCFRGRLTPGHQGGFIAFEQGLLLGWDLAARRPLVLPVDVAHSPAPCCDGSSALPAVTARVLGLPFPLAAGAGQLTGWCFHTPPVVRADWLWLTQGLLYAVKIAVIIYGNTGESSCS